MKFLLAAGFTLCLIMGCLIQETDPPVELGAVNWSRDLNAAKTQSDKTGKPILVLFQEVPG